MFQQFELVYIDASFIIYIKYNFKISYYLKLIFKIILEKYLFKIELL